MYYSIRDNKSVYSGIIAVVIYIALLVSLLFIVNFKFDPPVVEEGILMDLQGDLGQPAIMQHLAAVAEAESDAVAEELSAVEQEPELTQDIEESIVVEKPKPRKVKKQALFRPRAVSETVSKTSTASSANASGAGGYSGDKGVGGDGVDYDYSVGDRRVVGVLPLPSSNYGENKAGVVVIEVYVDARGYVVRTPVYKAEGSTTNDSELVRVSIEAARKARFTDSDNDVPQIGTISYTFKIS